MDMDGAGAFRGIRSSIGRWRGCGAGTGGPQGHGAGDRVSGPHGEIYIEYKQVGQAMKATAVDDATGTEVVVMGPASAARTDLQRVAVRKLQMKLEKVVGGGGDDPDDGNTPGSKGWIA